MRKFALLGQRAMAKGKLPLNDLAGSAGRMDVLVRGLMSALLTSHGLRENVEVILHLGGGPGPSRRIKFVGHEIKGMHADERSVAGLIAKVIREPHPPIGHWIERQYGVYDSGGTIHHTMDEWDNDLNIILDADGPTLWDNVPIKLNSDIEPSIGFILGDDQPLPHLDIKNGISLSLGNDWLQGSACISICHFILDNKQDFI